MMVEDLDVRLKLSEKQHEAFQVLLDKEHTELVYGGGSGGGKTWMGCLWILSMCLKHPGVRYVMGRAHLTDLKKSTLLTFFRLCKLFRLKKDEHYNYNNQEGIIHFINGSDVYLKDLFAYPSDPEFDSLGSTEYTGGFIDEASQVTVKAKNIITSRFGYMLDEYGLIPKLLIATNPCKHWAYHDYYKPWKEGSLLPYRKFIKALIGDNPFISLHRVEQLKRLDKASKERLLLGNWEFDDDPSRLFEYEDIVDLFTNNVPKGVDKFLVVDVARFGADKTVISYWEGLFLKGLWVYKGQSTKVTQDGILEKAKYFSVKRSNILVDEDGVGGGIVDNLSGIKGFVNNSKPIEDKSKKDEGKQIFNYANLKSQCYFYLAEYMRLGRIGVYHDIPETLKAELIEELEQIKRKDADKDGRLAVIGKDVIKQHIGRSTDLADIMCMRIFFELNPKSTGMIDFI